MRNSRTERPAIARALVLTLVVGLGLAVCGCGSDELPVAPAKGTVKYQGKLLEFGSVIFQPEKGPPARGTIQSDGSFVLGTYGSSDGAIIGKHKVRITCSETQKPGYTPPTGEEAGVGKSMIPKKYVSFRSSGLTKEVTESGPNEFNFELTD
jgi:hypothetical protein